MFYGITINDIYDAKLESKLQRLVGPRRTARIVIDKESQVGEVAPTVRMVKKYCDLMIQIQDSFGERDLSDAELYSKAYKLFKTFENDCKLWEIGNECGGEWCSPNLAERVKTIWGMMPVDHKAVLTLWWANPNWYILNPIKTDYILVSYYPSQNIEHGLNLRLWVDKVRSVNQSAFLGVGEYGFEEFEVKPAFRRSWAIRRQIESVHMSDSKWCGGYFYWDGQQEGF